MVKILICLCFTQYVSEKFQILISVEFSHDIIVNNLLIDKIVFRSGHYANATTLDLKRYVTTILTNSV